MDVVTLAELGPLIQGYLSLSTLISIDWSQLFSNDWNEHVKSEVVRLNNRFMDEGEACELLDKQHYKCRKCNADLSLDRQPVLELKEVYNYFMGTQTVNRRFFWVCDSCKTTISEKTRRQNLDQRIEQYTLQVDA